MMVLMSWGNVRTIKSLQTLLGQRLEKLAQPWGKAVNALLSLSRKTKLIPILPILIWMGKKAFARSIATYQELEAGLICFSKATTAGAAAAIRGYHLIKVYGCHPPGSTLDFLFSFLFYSIQIDELNVNITGTATPASFKPLMVALISQFPLTSMIVLLS